MKTTTSNFDTENAKTTNAPVAVIDFDSSDKYTTGTFDGIGASYKKYAKKARLQAGELDVLDGIQQRSQYEFEVIDGGSNDVTSTINNDLDIQHDITVKYGFQALAISDFFSIPNLKLSTTPTLSRSWDSWLFVAEDVRALIQGDIGRKFGATKLDGSYTWGSVTLDVDDASVLVDPDDFRQGTNDYIGSQWPYNETAGFIPPGPGDATRFEKWMYFKIENQIRRYTGISSNQLTAVSEPFYGNIREETFQTGTGLSQVWPFFGFVPPEALLYLLMSSDSNSSPTHDFYDLANYSANAEQLGVGLSEDVIDFDSFEALTGFFEKTRENCSGVILHERVNALKFINEILKASGLFLYSSGSKLKLGIVDRVFLVDQFSSLKSIDDDDVIDLSYRIADDKFFNKMIISYGGNQFSDSESNVVNATLTNSVSQYGNSKIAYDIKSNIIAYDDVELGTSAPSPDDIADYIAKRWLYSFGNPPAEIDARLQKDLIALEPGDEIDFTLANIPDVDSGSTGWSAREAILTSHEIELSDGRQDVSMRALSLDAMSRVTGFYNYTIVTSIDDPDLDFKEGNTVATQTEDAYHDPASGGTGGIFKVTVTLTPPGTGTTHHWVAIDVKLINTTVPTIKYQNSWKIRYYSGDSTPITRVFILNYKIGGAPNINRVKLDWYDCSASTLDGSNFQILTSEAPDSITFDKLEYSSFGQAVGAT